MLFVYQVSITPIYYNVKEFELDIEYLLDMTRLMESDNKEVKTRCFVDGNCVYGKYQLETKTVKWLKKLSKKEGVVINFKDDREVAKYLIKTRIKYESWRLEDRRSKEYLIEGGKYWQLYKTLYNTHRGKANIRRWQHVKSI